jgi:hypothetical protein
LDVDYGTPLGRCQANTNGTIFTREWTKATVTFDCNTWSAEITMK